MGNKLFYGGTIRDNRSALDTKTGLVWWFLGGLACFFGLTGGVGLLVPPIDGLYDCGDYLISRYILVGGILFGCLYMWVWSLVWIAVRRVFTAMTLVLVLAVGTNVVLGQDPLAAWTNWRLVVMKCAGVNEYFEFIANHEWIYYDVRTGKAVAGQGA